MRYVIVRRPSEQEPERQNFEIIGAATIPRVGDYVRLGVWRYVVMSVEHLCIPLAEKHIPMHVALNIYVHVEQVPA